MFGFFMGLAFLLKGKWGKVHEKGLWWKQSLLGQRLGKWAGKGRGGWLWDEVKGMKTMQKSSVERRGCEWCFNVYRCFSSTTYECPQHQEEEESLGKEGKIPMGFIFSKSSYNWFGFTLFKEGFNWFIFGSVCFYLTSFKALGFVCCPVRVRRSRPAVADWSCGELLLSSVVPPWRTSLSLCWGKTNTLSKKWLKISFQDRGKLQLK